MTGNPLWTYSVSVYEKPGVSTQLIQLQDDFGADVNLLLCACWLGQQQVLISSTQWTVLIKASAKWRAECILPLRSVRRFLGDYVSGGHVLGGYVSGGDASGGDAMGSYDRSDNFYQQLKELELEAERWQQDLLYQALQALPMDVCGQVTEQCIQHNLQSYCDCLPGVEWQDMSVGLSDFLVAARAQSIEAL